MWKLRRNRMPLVALTLAAVLVACGGGGNNGQTKVQVSSVKVVGASLADSGTFGFKFTVQSSTSTPYQVYTERIASTYGLPALCPHYAANLSVASANCTNYAVAGAVVHHFTGSAVDDVSGASTVGQLAAMAGSGAFAAGDLLIVGESSANDVAGLLTAYLTDAATASTSSPTHQFPALVTSLLGATAANAAFSANDNGATAGGAFMQALADKLVAAVNTYALTNGAKRVAVLNTLDVTKTPKFQAVLAGIRASGVTGPAQATGITNLANAWIQAYNARLIAQVAPYADRVVVVDFYSNFNDETANPAQYGLSNVSATVCDEVVNHGVTDIGTAGTTALDTPSVVAACTDASASATTPHAGDNTTNWWKSYLYADRFHPTPYGHQLLAQLVAKRLTEAGWL